MAGKVFRAGGKCPYCQDGRLLEKPRSAFEDELDEYSDPYAGMRFARRQTKSLLCTSCGTEINSREIESLERLMLA